MIGTWIVAVKMHQKMRPQEFFKPDTEGRRGEREVEYWKHNYSKDGVVYENKNERKEWIGNDNCQMIIVYIVLFIAGLFL